MSSRDKLFASLFDPQKMRKYFPHHDADLRQYLDEMGKIPRLTAAQEQDLLVRASGGDLEAQRHLIEANLRFVIAIAARFQGRGLSMLDLIQEGNIGLMEAIKRFDLSKPNRLGTYAKYWIFAVVSRAVAERGKLIHTPSSTSQRIEKIEQTIVDIQNQGREPTPKDIAQQMGYSVEQVVELLNLTQEPLSLYLREGDDDPLAETIAAPPLFLGDEITTPSLLVDVRHLIEKVLSPDERMVLEHRFGLSEEGVILEYREIAVICFHRTGPRADERIRQLERSGLAKLRAAFNEQEA